MKDAFDDELGFAPWSTQPIRYIDRTHAWYDALGYGNPYRYAQYAQVPFSPLRKPLAHSRVALLTTAAPYQPGKGDQGPQSPYNAAAKFYEVYSGDTAFDHDLRISHVGVHRTFMSDDAGCWFPLPALRRAAAAGRIGGVAARFHGVPTNRSQRHTLDIDAPEVLERCLADGAEVAVLVPNCPICHQTMALVARVLEAAGMPTVVMGAAKDIVEQCGVSRFVFSDFPLGHVAAHRGAEPAALERQPRLEAACAERRRAAARSATQAASRLPCQQAGGPRGARRHAPGAWLSCMNLKGSSA